tara:strand:+ start:475 stop:615 length:141 start_codon:yes stop_codon:yes gene_type:complete
MTEAQRAKIERIIRSNDLTPGEKEDMIEAVKLNVSITDYIIHHKHN